MTQIYSIFDCFISRDEVHCVCPFGSSYQDVKYDFKGNLFDLSIVIKMSLLLKAQLINMIVISQYDGFVFFFSRAPFVFWNTVLPQVLPKISFLEITS